jgi:hypothetical protein
MAMGGTGLPLRRLASLGVILSVLLLAACAGSGDTETEARFLVAPGKYTLYNCMQIAEVAKTKSERQHELEGLMAKAGTSSSGQLVNAVAYRPEYVTLRGEMMDLRQAAVDKKCDFVPGEPAGANDLSSRAIH